jgi:hypothetical protein
MVESMDGNNILRRNIEYLKPQKPSSPFWTLADRETLGKFISKIQTMNPSRESDGCVLQRMEEVGS